MDPYFVNYKISDESNQRTYDQIVSRVASLNFRNSVLDVLDSEWSVIGSLAIANQDVMSDFREAAI
jgi:hypothetical protein